MQGQQLTLFLNLFQPIGIEVTPASTCLSVDSNFTLSKGEGVFTGSICEVAASVTLRFYATDSLGNTHFAGPTPSIAVSGEAEARTVSISEKLSNYVR